MTSNQSKRKGDGVLFTTETPLSKLIARTGWAQRLLENSLTGRAQRLLGATKTMGRVPLPQVDWHKYVYGLLDGLDTSSADDQQAESVPPDWHSQPEHDQRRDKGYI